MPRHTRAFTLVELLVAVGIIAVLGAILIPMLGRAREASQRAACLSNLRQVGLVVQTYGQDNEGKVPIGYRSGFKQFNSMVYSGTSQKYCLFGILYLNKRMSSPEPFFCPANEDPQSNYNTEANPWPPKADPTKNCYVGYGFRPEHQLVDEFHIAAAPGHVPSLASFGNKAILADLTASVERIDRRHRDGVNVLYGDFSAAWIDRSRFEVPLSSCVTVPDKGANPYQDQIWEILDQR